MVGEALGRPGQDAVDVIGDLITERGLPQTLRAVGLAPGLPDTIAKTAMPDRLIHGNPRRIGGPTGLRKLLDAAR